MAHQTYWFGQAIAKAFNKEIDWDSDTIKVMLMTNSWTPNQDTMVYKSNLGAGECTSANYTSGGQALAQNANKAITYDAPTNTIKFDADDISWSNVTLTARYAVIYDDTPATDATKPLIGYVVFDQDLVASAGTFTITWDAGGILTITPA